MRTMKRKAEQKNRGEHCPHAVPGNIDKTVQREKKRADQSREAITLIGSFAHRKNFSNEKNQSDDDENHTEPAELAPKPKQITPGMDRTPIAVRSFAKNRENILKVAEANSDPGRILDQL